LNWVDKFFISTLPKLNLDDISGIPVFVLKLNWNDIFWTTVDVVNWVVLFYKFCKKSLEDEDESSTCTIIKGDKNGLFKLVLLLVLLVPKSPNPSKLLYWYSVAFVVIVYENILIIVV